MAVDRKLIQRVRDSLRDAAEPARAPGMQAYMKSAMPYMGVMAEPLSGLSKREALKNMGKLRG